MAKETKSMSLEEALNILKGDVLDLSRRAADEAMAIVRATDSTHPLLKKAEEEIKAFEKAVNEAKLYRTNLDAVAGVADTFDYDTFINDTTNEKTLKPLVESGIEIVDDKGEILKNEEKKEHFKRAYYGAREKAVADMVARKENFGAMSPEKVKNDLRDEIRAIFYGDLATIVAAGQMPKPIGKEKAFGSDEYLGFVQKQAQKANDIFVSLLDKGEKIKTKSAFFLANASDNIDKVDEHLQDVRNKLHSKYVQKSEEAKEAYSYAAAHWQKAKNHLITKAKALWGNRYVIMREIKKGFKDNKFKTIGDVTVSVGTALWMSAGAASAAAAGAVVAPVVTAAAATYAVYHAAGSWIWPVVAEMRRINRLKKENGEKKLSFKEQRKQAWKNITGDKNRRRSYVISGIVNTLAAAVIPGIVHHAAKGLDAARSLGEVTNTSLNVTLAQNISKVRQTTILSHLGAVVGSGAVDATTDRVMAGLTKDEAEKALLKKSAGRKAKVAAVSGTFGLGAQVLGFALGSHSADAQETVLGAVVGPKVPHAVPSFTGAHTDSLAVDSIGTHSVADSLVVADSVKMANNVRLDSLQLDSLQIAHPDSGYVVGGDVDSLTIDGGVAPGSVEVEGATTADSITQPSIVPTEWNQEMGISQKQFNTLMSTTEGTLSGENSNITLERAYANLDQIADKFDGMTKEQVLYKLNHLYAFTRKAVPVGDGTFREAPFGAEYLAERFGSMKLGLDDNAMSDLVNFAQEHTYDSKAELMNALKETYGEQFKGAQLNKMASIITSNQRFYQHGEEMEALLKALSCGEGKLLENSEAGRAMAEKVNALLQNTDALLKTGSKNVALTGLNLEDCHQDGGEWREVAKAVKEVTTEAKEENIPQVEAPVNMPSVEAETPNVETKAPIVEINTRSADAPIPEKSTIRPVEKVTIDHFNQLTGNEKPAWEKPVSKTSIDAGNFNQMTGRHER